MQTVQEHPEWQVAECAPDWEWLAVAACNIHSQFGEDGIISAFFDRYGAKNKTCFEVGAADGVYFSNTLALRNQGWDAVLIEPDQDNYAKLLSFASPNVKCVCDAVGPGAKKIDEILGRYSVPTDLDLGIIDIDARDYWAWADMERYRPRLMVVEFRQCATETDAPPRNATGEQQAGQNAIAWLAGEKGYVPLVRTRVNLICADKGVL